MMYKKILDKSDTDVLERYKPYIKDFETMAELATILKIEEWNKVT